MKEIRARSRGEARVGRASEATISVLANLASSEARYYLKPF